MGQPFVETILMENYALQVLALMLVTFALSRELLLDLGICQILIEYAVLEVLLETIQEVVEEALVQETTQSKVASVDPVLRTT